MLAHKSKASALDANESAKKKHKSGHSKAYKSAEFSGFTKEHLLKHIEHDTRTMRKLELKIEGKLESREKDFEEIHILSDHILNMYETLFETFEVDQKVVSDFIKFGSKSNVSTSKFRHLLDELMKLFHIDPELYIIGACYMYNDCNDIKYARRYFKRGINFHNNSLRLYLKEFDIEVKYLYRSEVDTFEMVYDKYTDITKRFKHSIDLQLILVDKVLKYTTLGKLHYVVINDLVNRYRRQEKMWQRLARMQWDGFLFSLETGTLEFGEDELTCMRNCFSIYDKALKKKIFPDNQQILWNFYLDCIIEICNTTNMKKKTIHDYMIRKIYDIFHQAFEDRALNKSEYFFFWADHSDEDTELMVLEKSVTVIREDIDLWIKLLGLLLYRDLYENASNVFQECIHILKNNGSRIWRMMELYLMNTEDSMILRFYEQASTQINYKKITLEFRPKYLNWCNLREDVCSARATFQKLKDLEPPCKALYLGMIKIENSTSASKRKKMSIIRHLFSEVCNKIGHKDIDLWIYYVKFECKQGSDSCVDTVYETALRTLKLGLRSSFTNKKKKLFNELGKKRKANVVIELSDD